MNTVVQTGRSNKKLKQGSEPVDIQLPDAASGIENNEERRKKPMGKLRKSLAVLIAVVCLTAVSFTSVFAASSPSGGKTTTSANAIYTVSTQAKTATYTAAKNKTKTVYKVVSYVAKNDKTYKVNAISAKAFKGCKNVKVIKVYSRFLTKVNKNAFKGISKSKLKKVVVRVVNKNMTNKNFKKLKKALIKAGIKASNIKRRS